MQRKQLDRIAAQAEQLPHDEGCVANRIETYSARRPIGVELTVMRCLDCGGANVSERKREDRHNGTE